MAKAITYTVKLSYIDKDKPDYKKLLSDLLQVLLPFDLQFSPEQVIKEYVAWAVEQAYSLSKNFSVSLGKKHILDTLKTITGERLQHYICNLILVGEGMPLKSYRK